MGPVLHEQEHIRDTYHQSRMVLFRPVTLSILALALPWYFANKFGVVHSIRYGLYIVSAIIITHILRTILIWWFNMYIVTNKRLIKISQVGIFHRTVMETPHERILNVSYKTTGMESALFHFGDVKVQVAGLIDPIVLRHIPHPAAIKDYLWQLHGRTKPDTNILQTNPGRRDESAQE